MTIGDREVSTVLVVEDDRVIRERLAAAVSADERLEVCGEAGDVAEGAALLETLRPAVLLTDLGLPDGSGIELIRRAYALGGIESIVVTVFGDESHMMDAIEAGATGYLLKSSALDSVGKAITEVLDGGSPISPSIARALIRRVKPESLGADDAGNNSAPLSAREMDVLKLIAKGLNYNEISEALGIAYYTVASHVQHIYRKLQVTSKSEAVFEAAQLGLIRVR